MESRIFTMSGILDTKNRFMKIELNPPIYLDEEKHYVLGLVGFETFNHIPNITSENCIFKYITHSSDHHIKIPSGNYDASSIHRYLQDNIGSDSLEMKLNPNTMQTVIKFVHDIDFTVDKSIGSLLGFGKTILKGGEWHTSENSVKIIGVNSLIVMCNIVSGSYKNDQVAHILHQFFPSVPPGYKIIDRPHPVIYLPITTSIISKIYIEIQDEHGKSVNFNQELVTLTLHLKSV